MNVLAVILMVGIMKAFSAHTRGHQGNHVAIISPSRWRYTDITLSVLCVNLEICVEGLDLSATAATESS